MLEAESIQADCLAEDIPIESEMLGWSRDQLAKFFETGGVERPPRLLPDPEPLPQESAVRLLSLDDPCSSSDDEDEAVGLSDPVSPSPPQAIAARSAPAYDAMLGDPPASASGVAGLRPLEWATCELLTEVLLRELPDDQLEADGIGRTPT